jgi:hypothetical protein
MLRNAGEDSDASTSTTGNGSPRLLACTRCERVITSTAERTEMDGSHEHVFVNPENDRFQIGCFNAAPGLLRVGPASMEATWFAGYSWQGEVCGGCRGFLGWLYRKGDHRFHGLILAGLIEVDED